MLANVWYADHIVVIDPATGKVVRTHDLSELMTEREGHEVRVPPSILCHAVLFAIPSL